MISRHLDKIFSLLRCTRLSHAIAGAANPPVTASTAPVRTAAEPILQHQGHDED